MSDQDAFNRQVLNTAVTIVADPRSPIDKALSNRPAINPNRPPAHLMRKRFPEPPVGIDPGMARTDAARASLGAIQKNWQKLAETANSLSNEQRYRMLDRARSTATQMVELMDATVKNLTDMSERLTASINEHISEPTNGQTLSDIRAYWQRQAMGKRNDNFAKIRNSIIEHGDRQTLRAITDLKVPPYLLGLTHEQTGLILTEAQQRFAPELWEKRKDVQRDIALLVRQRDNMQKQLGEGVQLLDNKDERLLADLAEK